jgi:hypothetical protein
MSDGVAGSTANKTPTTARTTSASMNGAADPNFNSQFPVKGEYYELNPGPRPIHALLHARICVLLLSRLSSLLTPCVFLQFQYFMFQQ